MPRWKDPSERGDFGAWLSAEVGEKTADWLAAEMGKRGHAHRADYYRAMMGGSKPPGRQIRRALVEFFGGGPAPQDEPEADPLAAAIKALADELRQWRIEDRARIEKLEAICARLAAPVLDPPGTPDVGAPAVPRKRAR
jgi:hypothetical protein